MRVCGDSFVKNRGDSGLGHTATGAVSGGIKDAECVGAFLQNFFDRHGKLLRHCGAAVTPLHDGLPLKEQFLGFGLDLENFGYGEAGGEKALSHAGGVVSTKAQGRTVFVWRFA